MNVVIAGSAKSTQIVLEALIEFNFNIFGTLSLVQSKSTNKYTYVDLGLISKQNNIPFLEFENINSPEVLTQLLQWKPDIIFIVGLSQLVKKELLAIPKIGCIGFHPTLLPLGRGRAPYAWLLLENETKAAVNFFVIEEGIDDGAILIQKAFDITPEDNVGSLRAKVHNTMHLALKEWLPLLKKGYWNPVKQNHELATYYEKRTPSDGVINWDKPAVEILKKIRATSLPLPGAYTYYKDSKIIIWHAEIEHDMKIKGVNGRILRINNGKLLVQTGEGLIWINEYEIERGNSECKILIGSKFGYNLEFEIYKIKKHLNL